LENEAARGLVYDRSSFVIMNKLMKQANQYKLPILVAHPTSSKKRQGYMVFVNRLRHILRMVPELGDVLAYYQKLGEPETKEANLQEFVFETL
jgi:hypothetical protein